MTLKPIETGSRFGRAFVSHDPRNRAYPARGNVFFADDPIRERVWRRGGAYDQGITPHCVAYTAKGMLNTAPFSAAEPYYRRSRYSTSEFYAGAQQRDQWPGEDYDGTSAQGVLAYLAERQIISEYRWCFGLDDLLRTLSHHGPVSVGAWWHAGMQRPEGERGLVSYEGSRLGGHQFEAIGVHPKEEEVEFMNSWGTGWGDRGRFRMKFFDVAVMLADEADAHTLITVN
jgi:hypothetical protein